MLEINLLDIVVTVILLAFLACGLLRGLTREVTGLVGVVGGFALAHTFQHKVQPSLEPLFDDPNIAAIMAFALILVCAMLLAALLGAALRKFMSITLTSWIDHLLGAMAGLAKGLLIMSLIFFLIHGFFPNLEIVKTAQATPLFNSLIDYLRGFLPAAFTYKLPPFPL
jgi:membrane protein required for colicin V production